MKAKAYRAKVPLNSPMHGWVKQVPQRDALSGYPRYFVEINSFVFTFASINELDHCVETLAQKNLPASIPNSHWLSRLPGWVKSWRYRERAVKDLKRARLQFAKAGGDLPWKTTSTEREMARSIRNFQPYLMKKRTARNKMLKHAKADLRRKKARP